MSWTPNAEGASERDSWKSKLWLKVEKKLYFPISDICLEHFIKMIPKYSKMQIIFSILLNISGCQMFYISLGQFLTMFYEHWTKSFQISYEN